MGEIARDEVIALMQLVNRAPLTQAEALWAQAFLNKLLALAAVPRTMPEDVPGPAGGDEGNR